MKVTITIESEYNLEYFDFTPGTPVSEAVVKAVKQYHRLEFVGEGDKVVVKDEENDFTVTVEPAAMESISEVVADIIENITEAQKSEIINTAEEDLIGYLHSWGRQIRNNYKLWQNEVLVRATGKEHPDDASMVIIRTVWEKLVELED